MKMDLSVIDEFEIGDEEESPRARKNEKTRSLTFGSIKKIEDKTEVVRIGSQKSSIKLIQTGSGEANEDEDTAAQQKEEENEKEKDEKNDHTGQIVRFADL